MLMPVQQNCFKHRRVLLLLTDRGIYCYLFPPTHIIRSANICQAFHTYKSNRILPTAPHEAPFSNFVLSFFHGKNSLLMSRFLY
jgi:hypothetical protein